MNTPPIDNITLRDYFAASAMQGLLTSEIVEEYSNQQIANIAYMVADAMIKERQRDPA
jgi:hypothetical protein